MVHLLLGLLISAACLYGAMRHIDREAVFQSLVQINGLLAFVACGGIWGSQWFRGTRWAKLLMPLHKVSPSQSFRIYSIGNLANLLIPLRGGDVLRAWMMARQTSQRKSAILATVVTERLLDLMVFGLLMGISVSVYPLPFWVMVTGLFVFLFSLGLSLSLILLKMGSLSFKGLKKILAVFLPESWVTKLDTLLQGFLHGIAPLHSARDYGLILIETLCMWGFQLAFIYALFQAFGFIEQYQLGVMTGVLMLALTTLAVTVPSSPSYAGTLHFMSVMALEISGVPSSEAFSYAVIFHFFQTGMGFVLGVYSLSGEKMGLKTLFQVFRKAQKNK